MSNLEKKKRRQVSFNINENLYRNYQRLLFEEGRTPTGDLTRYILKRVSEGSKE